MKPSTNNSGSQAAALLLTAAIASSSSSLAAAAADDSNTSSPAGVTCVDPSSLRLNECLTAGNAICSPGGGWAFGVDPADQRIKLWEGDEVRTSGLDFLFVELGRAPAAKANYSVLRKKELSDMLHLIIRHLNILARARWRQPNKSLPLLHERLSSFLFKIPCSLISSHTFDIFILSLPIFVVLCCATTHATL